ncbi:hypothetical protein [Lentzea sp. NPDC060358]|uniref:hypothetical protein n=1 Tax=Lentzea sp. NPDC060358 TaxID=3347103 RepID=UPI00365C80D9
MRTAWYLLGAFGVAAALSVARDVAGPLSVAGTPVPLSIETMRELANRSCERPPGYVRGTLQRVRDFVVEVGFTPNEMVVCKIFSDGFGTAKIGTGALGARYVANRMALVWPDYASLEIGRVAPEVAALEFVLPSGRVLQAEVHGEIFFCFVPEKTAALRVRAYGESGQVLFDAVI